MKSWVKDLFFFPPTTGLGWPNLKQQAIAAFIHFQFLICFSLARIQSPTISNFSIYEKASSNISPCIHPIFIIISSSSMSMSNHLSNRRCMPNNHGIPLSKQRYLRARYLSRAHCGASTFSQFNLRFAANPIKDIGKKNAVLFQLPLI